MHSFAGCCHSISPTGFVLKPGDPTSDSTHVGVGLLTPALVHACEVNRKRPPTRRSIIFRSYVGATPITRVSGHSAAPQKRCRLPTTFLGSYCGNSLVELCALPLHALRELFRVLKPGGRLVVSAFTPSADVARLYRPSLPEPGMNAFAGRPRTTLNRMAQCCMGLPHRTPCTPSKGQRKQLPGTDHACPAANLCGRSASFFSPPPKT